MAKLKFFIEQSWLLLVASVLFGLVLAMLNIAWEPRIIQNEIDKFNRLAGVMLTDAKDFKGSEEGGALVTVDIGKGKTIETEVKKGVDADGKIVGWAFVAEGSGFADKIKLVVTVDAEFEDMGGFGVLSSLETPGFGDKIKKEDFYRNQFVHAPVEEFILSRTGDDEVIDSEIVAITGATVTSEAVVDILNNFLGQVKAQLKKEGLI